MSSQEFLIEGPCGLLEVLVELPSSSPTSIGVVCHPHPLFQGTMHNKVAYMLARCFRDENMVAIRFNFRGVGKSEGEHADGQGEVDDVLAVIAWAQLKWPSLVVNLAGFSFGSYVALRVVQNNHGFTQNLRLNSLITVAPPVGRWDFNDILKPRIPWLTIQGLEDELVEPQSVKNWIHLFSPIPDLVEISGADHFFHGKLTVLRETANNWLKEL